MARPPYLHIPPWLWLIALVGCMLSLATAQQARRDAGTEAMQRLAFSADQVTLRVEERLAAYALILRGASALFVASETVDRGEWRTFVEGLQASALLGTTSRGIGFARHVPADRLAAYLATVRADGFTDHAITPSGERRAYGPVHYIEPFGGRNRDALGYDMFAEPIRRARHGAGPGHRQGEP